MSVGSRGKSDDVIKQYIAKSSSKSKSLGNLRQMSSQRKSEASRELVEKLSKSTKQNPSFSAEVTEVLRSTAPTSIKSGTVGEDLYSCFVPQSKDLPSECTPECISGISITSECKVPVYVKSKSKLTKLNSVSGSEANVFLQESDIELTDEDEEALSSDGISSANIFVREGGTITYKKSCDKSISSQSSTRSKSECTASSTESSGATSCSPAPPKQECKLKKNKESSWGMYLVFGVILLILLACVACWYFGLFASTAATVVHVAKTNSHTPLQKRACAAPPDMTYTRTESSSWC